jgi:hypothetical protein
MPACNACPVLWMIQSALRGLFASPIAQSELCGTRTMGLCAEQRSSELGGGMFVDKGYFIVAQAFR